ncbi:uncharacterized protein LOC127712266 isoform X2 [Mytilus californianus]|uniref:uncharacterized protein LOC127712266 isoform X2 n=1 Tax=Mytilus californianus TaxID=6549 RepID=UPI0022463159|nr:uncharacterized protein LOC127712266 isoform X2 [Mytilus californianus]
MAIPIENNNGIRIISVGQTGRGKSEMCKAILGIRKLNNDCSIPGMDACKHHSRLQNANRYGTAITIVDTPGIRDMADVSETSKKIKTELKLCQQHVAVFYTVYKTMTEIDKICVERIRRNMDCITRRKMFLVLTDFIDINDDENSRYTKSKVAVLRLNSKLQDNEDAELQIKTIIRKIQIRENLMKRYSAVVVVPVFKSTTFLLILCMVLLQEARANNTTKPQLIQWKLMTKPVYFGGNVDLECTIKTEDTSAPMAWVRIPNGEAIAYNKIPANRQKYGITVKYIEKTMIYNLTIKQFDSTDINRVYRCDFGFQSYADELLLNDKNFISKPTEKDVEYNFNLVGKILVGLVMIYNGYPKPVCTILFEGEHILDSVIINDKNTSIFYDTRIKVKYNTNLCRGNVNVSCSYVDKKVNIEQHVDACSDSSIQRHKGFNATIPAISAGVLLPVVVCVVLFLLYRSRRSQNNGNQQFDVEPRIRQPVSEESHHMLEL